MCRCVFVAQFKAKVSTKNVAVHHVFKFHCPWLFLNSADRKRIQNYNEEAELGAWKVPTKPCLLYEEYLVKTFLANEKTR